MKALIKKLRTKLLKRFSVETVGIVTGLIVAPLVIALVACMLFLLSSVFVMPAQAAGASAPQPPRTTVQATLNLSIPAPQEKRTLLWPFPEPPYAFIGINHETNNTFCAKAQPGAKQDKLVGDLGFGQAVKVTKNFRFVIEYHHHSCAFGVDAESYDAIGFRIIFSPWR